MVDGLTFFAVGSLLFVFWAYGVVSFGLDVKNKFIPMARRYIEGRRAEAERKQKEQEREEREKQLY